MPNYAICLFCGKCAFFFLSGLQLSNMNMQNQNNHSFINNGKANAGILQMNNLGALNGMQYNNAATRQYAQHQVNSSKQSNHMHIFI